MKINRPCLPLDGNKVQVGVQHRTRLTCHQQHHLKHHWKLWHRDHSNPHRLVHQEVVEDQPGVFTVELVDAVLVVQETEISKKDEFQFLVVLEHLAPLATNQESQQAALDKREKLTKK